MKPSKGTLYNFLEKKYRIFYKSIDGCNSILKICNTRVCAVQISLLFLFLGSESKKKERQDKTPKIIGYSMWIPYSMMFTCLCFLWRVHATCSVVKMDV
jgi:hypothetical protein